MTAHYIEEFSSIRSSSFNWIAYLGRSGSGKSTQAFMIVDELLERRDPVYAKIYTYPELTRELSSLRFRQEEYENKIDEVLDADLVVLDDFLDIVPKAESFEEQIALNLIKRRYSQRKPLIITTELTPPDFQRLMPRHGEAILGRIFEMSAGRIAIAPSSHVNYRLTRTANA